jgi:hypothetical protein
VGVRYGEEKENRKEEKALKNWIDDYLSSGWILCQRTGMLSTADGEAGARPAEAARASRFTSTTRHVSPQTEFYTLIKKRKFSSYVMEFRKEQLQSHI